MTSHPLKEGPSGLGMSNDITSSQVIDETDQRDQVVWG